MFKLDPLPGDQDEWLDVIYSPFPGAPEWGTSDATWRSRRYQIRQVHAGCRCLQSLADDRRVGC